MNLALNIAGVFAISILLTYKLNFVVLFHRGPVAKNVFVVLKEKWGLFAGVCFCLITLAVLLKLSVNGYLILWADLLISLAMISYIDIRQKVIPNRLNLAFLLSQLTAMYMIVRGKLDVLNLIITAIVALVLTLLSYKSKEEIGMGDVKLLIVINCVYGLFYVLYTVLFSMILVLVAVLPGMFRKKINLRTSIPFAPFYLIGTIIYYIVM